MKETRALLVQLINKDMMPYWYKPAQSVIWQAKHTDASGQDRFLSWSLVFDSSDNFASFKRSWIQCLWESKNKAPFSKCKDPDWIFGAYEEDVAMEKDDGIQEFDLLDFAEEDPGARSDDSGEEDSDSLYDEEEECSDDFEEEDEDSDINEDPNATNQALAVAYRQDRSFVSRGDNIGVFRHTPNGKVKYATTIKKIKTPKGKKYEPKKMMLHEQDESMLFLDPSDPFKVMRMDLTRGEIVDEWKTSDQCRMNEILPRTKYAQLTPQKTFVGLNRQGFFLVDPRVSGKKHVKNSAQFYGLASAPAFKSAATTDAGQIATGSSKGEIRMFSKNTFESSSTRPRPKTMLPGFGDAIIGIDVTADGKWILATCSTYLLVIPTSMPGSDERNGFEVRMGKDKPVPRLLQLKRAHIEMMGGKIRFTPARFNTGVNPERSIVTSSGRFVITWNFRKVRQNILTEYKIKEESDTVIADQFKYNEDKSVIVAMPNDVHMQNRVVKHWSPKKKSSSLLFKD
eukprot:TRINITY_DN6764_c0_g1_i1.p1 TRINITY_DN6764_c0_g1~~TRINITY_DN6764_c0_g1_i1.p1  ORF type:complete len:512 (-),score=100.16 TRINITY_DN6764_c0_g1_i1:58-1593(-)